MDNLELLKSISFDIGILAISTLATFFIPGISGIIISGIIQITGQTLGIQINGGNLPSDPI
ncbi:UNVERIFIED_CONTAM: hypothetical protein RF648_18435 [Kocuria sp. CPCC 205274]|uniref:Uncharacterized protein n=1 Tax=Herbiconiux daphne TaxID=2970914 RepID=A0ABT2H9K3_9MICO|nr:hypothetical protein [Herbiconiux daphne]MCS5736577.1 hypothetical protein [Herbiconiux daphne]